MRHRPEELNLRFQNISERSRQILKAAEKKTAQQIIDEVKES